MAEQPAEITNQHTADDKNEETQSTAEDHVLAGDGSKQEENLADLNETQKNPGGKQDKEDSASLSACTDSETRSESSQEPAYVENADKAVKEMTPPAEQLTSLEIENTPANTDSSVKTQPDDESHDHLNRDSQKNEQPIIKEEKISNREHSEDKDTQETEKPLNNEGYPREDGPQKVNTEDSEGTSNMDIGAKIDVETIGATSSETAHSEEADMAVKIVPPAEQLRSSEFQNTQTNTDSSVSPQPDDESRGQLNRDSHENEQQIEKEEKHSKRDHSGDKVTQETTSPQRDVAFPREDGPQEVETEDSKETNNTNIEEEKGVKTIGAASSETAQSGGIGRYLVVLGLVFLVLAFMMQKLLYPESPPQKTDEQQVDIFLRQMEKVMAQFPNQRPELWKRSRIHLLRHLKTAQPTEPVSLILTAGLRAERTLHCLAQSLAFAFSAAHSASVLQIDGASKASQDSDLVKLEIDRNLQGAFEGDKPVAVIHRFEELPPGSTLIFYRYCDHENAAYKKTFLIFTVLLGEEQDIPAQSQLNAVEEMVDDHLQKKFLSDSHPVSYDKMDLDKYGGLWSRISHLILPVAAEKKIELHGCGRT